MTADDRLLLRVAAAAPIAQGIHRFDLRSADGSPLPPFTPGAHIGVHVPGVGPRRHALCNDPAADHYEIVAACEADEQDAPAHDLDPSPGARPRGVPARAPGLVDRVRIGDMLECDRPRNDFALAPRAAAFVFIAAGIGIAPIMSMVRHLAGAGGPPFRLYYLTRSPEATAFRAELAAPALRGAVVLHHDGGDPERAFDLWPVLERPTAAHLYCCGPRSLMEAVRDMTGHWSSARVHFASFVDASATRTPADRAFAVRLARSGRLVPVGAQESILEALRRAGLTIASSCESGTCGTCRTTLLGGDADHRDLVLSDADRERSIMVCVSRARSDVLELDL